MSSDARSTFLAALTPGDVGLLILRVFAGTALCLAHGLGKVPPSDRFVAGVVEMGFPMPLVFAWAAAFAESIGGFLLALGLMTRPAALAMFGTMTVAAFIRQAGDPFVERELAFMYWVVAIAFLVMGPGRLSLDHALDVRLPRIRSRPPSRRAPLVVPAREEL